MSTETKTNPDHAKKQHTMSFEEAIKALDGLEQKLTDYYNNPPAHAIGPDGAIKIPDLCAFWAEGHQVLDIVKTLLFWRPKCQTWIGNLIGNVDSTCKINQPPTA